jgi:hypothetical protein
MERRQMNFKVDRENGFAETRVDTDTIITIVIVGRHLLDKDMLDRLLQHALMELGLETVPKAFEQEVETGKE